MNIPSWTVTGGLVVIIIEGAAWIYGRGTDKNAPHGSDNDKVER